MEHASRVAAPPAWEGICVPVHLVIFKEWNKANPPRWDWALMVLEPDKVDIRGIIDTERRRAWLACEAEHEKEYGPLLAKLEEIQAALVRKDSEHAREVANDNLELATLRARLATVEEKAREVVEANFQGRSSDCEEAIGGLAALVRP